MSTDYDAACFTCRRAIHLGQRFTTGWSFGYGTGDVVGERSAGSWLLEHLEPGHDVRVLVADAVPSEFGRDEYDDRGGFRDQPD